VTDEDVAVAYCQFHWAIYSYILERVSNAAIAEELSQEVFVKVHRFRDTYDARYALTTWIWNIAKNTIIDYFRSPHADSKNDGGVDDLSTHEPTPEARLLWRERRKFIGGKMMKLTKNQRQAFYLRAFQGRTHQEIAHHLGITKAASKQLNLRARSNLIRKGKS
jgi:RNA polymerase sigma-70 factor (ECF subfamily)